MSWDFDALVIIGVIFLFAALLLEAFSNDSKVAGTSVWRMKNISWIIFGIVGLAGGLMSLYDYFQDLKVIDLIYGLMLPFIGSWFIWSGTKELRHIETNPRLEASFYAIAGAFLVITNLFSLYFDIQEEGTFSFIDLIEIGFGIYIFIFYARQFVQLKRESREPESIS